MTDTSSLYDLHPVELAAHALLSAPLDHLNDNFGQLHQSQVILHARLRLIEKRLEALQRSLEPADAGGAGAGGSGGAADASSAGTASAASADAAADRDEVKSVLARVRASKRRLAATAKLLRKVVERVDALEAEVDPTT